MSFTAFHRRQRVCLIVLPVISLWFLVATAQETNQLHPIDLPSALRLAGAQNLDIAIAQQRLKQAEGERSSALERFFPWISPGASYHHRDGLAQATPSGIVGSTDSESYSPGATIGAQIELGDAIYKTLVAKQLVRASSAAVEAQRQDTVLTAARRYFDLTRAKALADVSREAWQTSELYRGQLHEAVAAGIAFKGDELRVQTESDGYQIALRHAQEEQRIAASSLAEVLHLDPVIELVPAEDGLKRLDLFGTNAALSTLVRRALQLRPELQQTRALVSAAHGNMNGAEYGPLIPSLGAQVFAGGFGGGPEDGPSRFGSTEDYLVGISWRIGAGGLFDFAHLKTAKAQVTAIELTEVRLKDSITAQVVTAFTRLQSLSDQIEMAQRKLNSATEMLQLTRERKQFGVGIVLEDIQAQQAVTQTRAQYVNAIADFNAGQYELQKAVGGSSDKP